MNWSQLQSLFDGQGLVFWAAVTAVTLGLTLLSVSIVFQIRKIAGNGAIRLKVPRRKTVSAPAPSESSPRITVTGDRYQASGFVPSPPATPEPANASDPLLENLLARLKASADRLDGIHGALGRRSAPNPAAGHSPLKSAVADVDYVYRTGHA